MKWDKQGAVKALDANECFVCKRVKPVYVVVTVHMKKDLHFPCCSEACSGLLAEWIGEIQAEKLK